MKFLATTIGKAVAVLLVVVLILGVLQIRSCQQARQQAAQSRVDKAQHGALENSAADAINTQGEVSARDRASEDITRTNEKDIRNAEGANDPVNPAARDAGLASLCRRAAYRDSERCRLRQLDPS